MDSRIVLSSERQHTESPRIAIVADDLTGACDSGIEFLRCAGSVMVAAESDSRSDASLDEGVIVFNTQSRRLSPQHAYDKAFGATRRALSAGANLVFKKVDSALRGNFGVEVAAVMDAADASVAFILPAIPEAGRETIGGVQRIDGLPIAESFYSRDPEHPVTESNILVRAEMGSRRKAGLISLDEVRSGTTIETATKLRDQGCQMIVVDARSSSDLDRATKASMQFLPAAIFVGCQGLARALAVQFPGVRELPQSIPRVASPMLVVCGTLHPQSKRQLDAAVRSGEFDLIKVALSQMTEHSRRDAFVGNIVENCRRRLAKGRSVALCVHEEEPSLGGDVPESILTCLSSVCRDLIRATRPGITILTGGETAYSVCRALGIRVLKLHARIAPLVVACSVVGGPCHDMVVVVKGGSIGPDDLLCRIHSSLSEGK